VLKLLPHKKDNFTFPHLEASETGCCRGLGFCFGGDETLQVFCVPSMAVPERSGYVILEDS